MKTKLFTLTLLLISTATFAQKNFDRATFDLLMNRYAQDPVKFLKTETVPDFVFIGSDGQANGVSQVLGIYERNTQTARNYENVAVRQKGNTGVATGILTHSYVSKASGRPWQQRESFTYVFNSPKPGQWQLVTAQHGPAPSAPAAEDEAAIKKVIESSTTAIYAKDVPTYKSLWANASYISRINAGTEGKISKMVGDEFQKAYEDWEKNGKPVDIKVTRSNWLIRINGTSSFVIFDQHNQYPDGTTRDSVEERYLERMNGEWKIVNVTVLPRK